MLISNELQKYVIGSRTEGEGPHKRLIDFRTASSGATRFSG